MAEISLLHSTGWSLDDALHEMTSVRSDVGNLLQLRARPPPPPQKPPPCIPGQKGSGKSKGKDKGQKGKQSTQPGKRKTPGDGTAQEIKTSDLVQQHGNKTFCIRFNKGHCRNAQCKYLHACAFKLPNGEPCGKKPSSVPASQPAGGTLVLTAAAGWRRACPVASVVVPAS